MSGSFDPYRKWLGISAPDRPPNHYQLLGLHLFEADEETIGHAAERRIAYLRNLGSDHAELRRRILGELTTARACLLNAKRKNDYDRQLRAMLPALPAKAPPIVRPAAAIAEPVGPLDLPPATVSRVVIKRLPRKTQHKTSQTVILTVALSAVVIVALPLAWLATRSSAVRPDDPSETASTAATADPTQMLNGTVIRVNEQDESVVDKPEDSDPSDKPDSETPPEEPPLKPEPTTQPGGAAPPATAQGETQERQFVELVGMTFIAAGVTRRTGYRPARAELEATAESVKKAPRGLAAPKYGVLSLVDRHWPVIVDEPEARRARLYVDTNGDGDLTNDPPAIWMPTANNSFAKYEGQAQIDLGGGRLAAVRLYRFDPNDPKRAQFKNSLFFYPDFGYEVTLNLDGRPFSALLSGLPTVNSWLAIDRDGNQRISGKRETVYVNKPFNYTGTTYVLTLNAGQLSLSKATPELPVTPPPPDLAVGKQALPFTMAALDGATIDFPRQYAGKLVMLDFWSTWCPPCRVEAPNVASAYKTWHDQGFEVLGVNFDDKDMADKLTAFTKENGMPWPQIYEGKMWATTLGELYDVNAIPFALLVDGDSGQIVAASQELRGSRLSDVIGKALAKKSGKTNSEPPRALNDGGQMVQNNDPASPPLVAAPVTEEAARRFQQHWAEHLQIPPRHTNSIGMSFVLVPPGDYALDPPPKAGQSQARRTTRVARAFYLATHEVTQEAYWKVTKTNPSFFAFGSGGTGRLTGPTHQHPVEQVSWRDAVQFCNALSRLEKLPNYYQINGNTAKPLDNNGYRLPSVSEWNCAASGGGDWEWAQTPATWPRFAWHQANSGGRTRPVGMKQPNAFGLFDIYGNVWEYCAEPGSFRGYTYGSPASEMNIRRGPTNDTDFRAPDLGFRIARTPEPDEQALVGKKSGSAEAKKAGRRRSAASGQSVPSNRAPKKTVQTAGSGAVAAQSILEATSFRVTASIQDRLDASGKRWDRGIDTIGAVNDGLLAKSSREQRAGRFTWWPHTGGVEWLQYDFAGPQIVDGAEVYWFDDTPDGGSCKPPRSWRLLYRDGERWQPVSEAGGYPVDINRVCRTHFTPVTTSAMRLELQLHDGFSSGLFEWRLTRSADTAAPNGSNTILPGRR